MKGSWEKGITGKADLGETFSDSLEEAKVFIILYQIIQGKQKNLPWNYLDLQTKFFKSTQNKIV